jgi:hypothetical protein
MARDCEHFSCIFDYFSSSFEKVLFKFLFKDKKSCKADHKGQDGRGVEAFSIRHYESESG